MSRKTEDRLADIRAACEKVLKFTSGYELNRFAEDDLVFDAVLHNIEIIGEATKNLPPETRARMPAVEWSRIARMRDIVSHAYFRIDPGIVWDVVTNKIPVLLHTLQTLDGGEEA